jgi:hypothetical protein
VDLRSGEKEAGRERPAPGGAAQVLETVDDEEEELDDDELELELDDVDVEAPGAVGSPPLHATSERPTTREIAAK